MDVKKDLIIAAIKEVLPECESILLRNDSSARLQEGLTQTVEAAYGQVPEKIYLEENNAQFEAPVWKGQKTGWFYDHRMNRLRLKDYVADNISGKRVLDVFSYLGAWGIQAGLQGANEVVCVDSSPLSAEWIASHAAMNQLSDKVKVTTLDAFDALKKFLKNKDTFDVVILDPPAFVKKQKDKKEGFIAYQRINELALKLLKKDGILFSCSCSMHVNHDDFIQILRRASLHAGCELQILERGHQAVDHPVHVAIPETDYLKMVIARRL